MRPAASHSTPPCLHAGVLLPARRARRYELMHRDSPRGTARLLRSRRGRAQRGETRGQVEARLANLSPCLIGMEACVGAHHLSRKLQALGHDARLMPGKGGALLCPQPWFILDVLAQPFAEG